jgi:hypothetical protein
MTRTAYIWFAAALAVLALGFLAGRTLHSEGDSKAPLADGPAFEATATIAGLSKAGFSGFSESTAGRTVLAGRIVAVEGDTITLEGTSGARSMLRLSGSGPLTRLEPSTLAALRPGVTVLLRRAQDGDAAAAALIVAEP